MKDCKSYRAIGWKFQKEHGWYLVAIMLLYVCFTAAISFTVVGPLIVLGPCMVAISIYALGLYRNGDRDYKKLKVVLNDFINNLIMGLLITLYVFLWSLLFIIPGIIKALGYSMAYFIKADNPTMDPKVCLKESERLMDGHKKQLFLLMLSYIGWIILSGLTCGILAFWVYPSMYGAFINFYQDLINDEPEYTKPKETLFNDSSDESSYSEDGHSATKDDGMFKY